MTTHTPLNKPDQLDEAWIGESRLLLALTVLPPFIRRSVPRFRSLSRHLSFSDDVASTRSRASSSDGSGTRTPPPSYQETSTPVTTTLKVSYEGLQGKGGRARSSSCEKVSQDGDSVEWKYAAQGLSLLNLSVSESTSSTPSSPFGRQLYIHALTYLLRGLPTSLSQEETLSLRTSLPPSLLSDPAIRNTQQKQSKTKEGKEATDTNPTFLHRLISSTTLQLFIFVSLLLPWLQYFVQQAYTYERDHRVSEKVVKGTIATGNVLGQKTWGVAQGIQGSWVLQSLAGGLFDGIGEGMEVLRARDGEGKEQR